jgi:hypothetical protein
VNCFTLFFDCSGGGVCLYLFILIVFIVQGEGGDG